MVAGTTEGQTFSNGDAFIYVSEFIPTGYELNNAICQLSETNGIFIASTWVNSSTGVVSVRCIKILDATRYNGSTAGIIRFFLFLKKK